MSFGLFAAAAAGTVAAAKRMAFLRCGMAAAAAFTIAWSTAAYAAPIIVVSGPDGTIEDDIPSDGTPDDSFQSSIVVRRAAWEQRGVAEFNIGGIRTLVAGGATFNSVRLELTTPGVDWNTDNFLLDVYGYVGNGLFDLGDFSQGSLLTSATLNNDDVVVGFDVSGFVLDMLDGTDNHAGFNLRGGNAGFGFGYAQFLGGPAAVAPRLVFDFVAPVPEPASLALFGFGLAALAARRRPRR